MRTSIAILCIISSFLTGCDNAGKALEDARSKNTEEAYEQVVQLYPDSREAINAKTSLYKMRLQKARESAQPSDVARFVALYGATSETSALLLEKCTPLVNADRSIAECESVEKLVHVPLGQDVICFLEGLRYQQAARFIGEPPAPIVGSFERLTCALTENIKRRKVISTHWTKIENSRISTKDFDYIIMVNSPSATQQFGKLLVTRRAEEKLRRYLAE
jgi:predicted RNase H-like HicB family nuclease